MTTMKDALLLHDYTVGDVERLARIAVSRCWVTEGPSWQDRYDAAWHGVVEALYAAEEPPTSHDLITAGWQAVYDEAEDDRQSKGRRNGTGDVGPRFAKFWHGSNPNPDPSLPMIERIATVQILPMLTPEQCEAVLALAMHDSVTEAAESLGIPVGTMKSRLSAARERFRAWWHEGETPVVHRDLSATCREGHDVAEFGRVSAGGLRYCTKCRAEYKRRRRAKGLAA